jgi:protein-L-isoaspartate(D-aspartate) O-methyltransferase
MTAMSLKAAREAFAEELRVAAPVVNDMRIVRAFATVPREKFLGPGPWMVHGIHTYRTPDTDPRWLYHNVLAVLKRRKGGVNVNNGQPSFWAYLLDRLEVKAGDRVLQIGAGTGYYTAILAELAGPRGKVLAVEIDKSLARRARTALKDRKNVEVVCADASTLDPGEIDVVIAFAGGTHPAPLWLKRLAPLGRLLMPIVPESGFGFMLKAVRSASGFSAEAVTWVGVILAAGFRSEREARSLKTALDNLKGKLPKLKRLRLGKAPRNKAGLFLKGEDYYLE